MKEIHKPARKPGDEARSPHWPATRRQHLRIEPACQVCGREDHLNVHHVLPFHLHPELELDQRNLITLCEPRGRGCHLLLGHLLSWKSYNANIRAMAADLRKRIRNRPAA